MTKTLKLLKSRTVEKKTKEETTMAEIYKNIKTMVVAELVEVNEKTKQVTLKKADGKFTASNKSAFEKYWKKIEDNSKSKTKEKKQIEKKSVESKSEETPAEDKKADIANDVKTEETKQIEQPAEEPKKANKKQKKEKKERVKNTENVSQIVTAIHDFMLKCDGCDVGVPREETMRFRALRFNGRQFCKLMWSDKSVRLYFRCDVSKYDESVEKVNYALPYLYISYTFNADEVAKISDMFKAAIVFEQSRAVEKKNSKKTKKDEREAE